MASDKPRGDDDEQISLSFVPIQDRESAERRLDPFVAPVASNSGAVAKDSAMREMAKAVYGAFGDLDDGEGLTRGTILTACADQFRTDALNSRLDLFIDMKLLMPVGAPGKPHQVRYCFNPTSAAALLVFDRVIEVGGTQEITLLLSRTAQDIETGALNEADVSGRITQARRALAINTGNLLRLVRTSTAAAITYLARSYERPRRVRWWYQADRAWCLRR